jgi:DNA-directed RNA polymerase specialized sigma24 family protein
MGIKPGAVLTRLHRARIKLKQALEDGNGRMQVARRSDEM